MPEIDADAFNAFEAAGWEAKAAGYDHFFGAFTSRLVDPLLDVAEVGPGRSERSGLRSRRGC
jgi:hypothetical protein